MAGNQLAQRYIDRLALRASPYQLLSFVQNVIVDLDVGSHTPEYTPIRVCGRTRESCPGVAVVAFTSVAAYLVAITIERVLEASRLRRAGDPARQLQGANGRLSR
jgi:hypothetical protein